MRHTTLLARLILALIATIIAVALWAFLRSAPTKPVEPLPEWTKTA